MSTDAAIVPIESGRHSLLTLASVGIVACILADMVHEALGHGVANLLTGDRMLFLSTVAVQNADPNRLVSAAGTSANFIVGALTLLLLRRAKSLTPTTCFLWLFSGFNLLNSGYLVFSAVLNSGDWANVIAGFSPPWLWRCLIGVAGAALYALSIRWMARSMVCLGMIRLGKDGEAGVADLQHIVLAAYLAGGAVMTIASIFNPISPSLILTAGIGASFGLNAGLLLVPGIVGGKAQGQPISASPLPLSYLWLFLALVFAGIFIAVLGPGIHFAT